MVLITGAAGFIGYHTSIKFIENKIKVVGIDNINNYYSTKLKLDILLWVVILMNLVP